MKVYLIDVGVLLEKDNPEYEAYSTVYDKKHGFYDENQYYLADREQALVEAKDYVANGVEGTYAIVSETDVDDCVIEDVGLADLPVEEESYLLGGVVYSCTKEAGEIKENFLG